MQNIKLKSSTPIIELNNSGNYLPFIVYIRGVDFLKESILFPDTYPFSNIKKRITKAVKSKKNKNIIIKRVNAMMKGDIFFYEDRSLNVINHEDFIAFSIELLASDKETVKNYIFNLTFVNPNEQFIEIREYVKIC